MNANEVKTFWVKQSDEDWRVVKSLFANKHYSHALFYCHLSLEKVLKALVVQETKQQSPYIHDLLILTQRAGIHFSQEQQGQLNEITMFNIRGRYDDVKYQFYKKATKAYTEKYIKITGELRIWIKKNYLKK
jgi:HEPN domain-containing protein